MNVLVTGSSGFVGSHLVEELIRKRYRVRVLLRPGKAVSRWLTDLPLETVEAAYDDPRALANALKGMEIIFHIGGVTRGVTVADYYAGNAETTKSLLEAAAGLRKKPRRFLLVSSHAMMGPAAGPSSPSKEDDVPVPVEAYGRSKLAAELIARSYSHLIPITIVRPPSVYGPRDVDCFELFKQVSRHINLFFGNAKKYTGLIHVDDLVQGIITAATSHKAANRAYFLCSEEAITWRALQDAIKRGSGTWAVTIHIPAFTTKIAALFGELKMKITGKAVLINKQKIKLARPGNWCLSGERARKELRFKPSVSLSKGIRNSWDWYREQGWL